MDLTSALLGVVMILSVLSEVDVMCIMAQKDFISWDDMRVNEHKYRNMIREESYSNEGQSNRSGVILVDKNGRGDSITVQGAVNMVPENNSQRVKILILAGTYRFGRVHCNHL